MKQVDMGEEPNREPVSVEVEEFEDVGVALSELGEWATEDGIDQVSLTGPWGVVALQDPNESNHFETALIKAFLETTQAIHVDEQIVEDNHGEVTPETKMREVELQLDNFFGHNGLKRELMDNLELRLGARGVTGHAD